MLTLIMREIEDNRVFFIAAILLMVIFGILLFYQQFYDQTNEDRMIALAVGFSVLLPIAFCAMGAAQMFGDRTKKISALLATLAVNRGQIFTARIIAGTLLVLIGFATIAGAIITAISHNKWIAPFPPLKAPIGLYFEILIPALLLGFASYCIGLQVGWTQNKLMPTLGALGLSIILIPVIVIKSFGWEIYAILIVLIAACITRAWHKFSTTAL
jgi:ABC-type transport system involved in multi-copper enzyme maturation permease subunit